MKSGNTRVALPRILVYIRYYGLQTHIYDPLDRVYTNFSNDHTFACVNSSAGICEINAQGIRVLQRPIYTRAKIRKLRCICQYEKYFFVRMAFSSLTRNRLYNGCGKMSCIGQSALKIFFFNLVR